MVVALMPIIAGEAYIDPSALAKRQLVRNIIGKAVEDGNQNWDFVVLGERAIAALTAAGFEIIKVREVEEK